MKPLTSAQRRELKGRAHALHPIVMIGEDGLSPGVLAEIERGLLSHELIKVRVFAAGHDEREAMLAAICQQTGAQAVQHIGKVLVIYRKKPHEARIAPRRVPQPRAPRSSGEARPGADKPRRSPRPPAGPSRAARPASASGSGKRGLGRRSGPH